MRLIQLVWNACRLYSKNCLTRIDFYEVMEKLFYLVMQ